MPLEFTNYHDSLLRARGYVARPHFLAFTTWCYQGQFEFELSDNTSLTALPLIVVGKVLDEPNVLDVQSIVKTALCTNIATLDIQPEICVSPTDVLDEFQADFKEGWANLRSLQLSLPAQQKLQCRPYSLRQACLELMLDKILFKIPLFQPKVCHSNAVTTFDH
jgi:hypothetical protein